MKQKYIYPLLFGIPGIAISAFIAIFVSGATTGFFWIFVFGDNAWPFWTGWVIAVIGVAVFTIALSAIVIIGFSYGKNRESKNRPVGRKQIIISAATLILLVLLMIIFQRGYVFEEPDHQICFNMCVQKGYDGANISLSPKDFGNRVCSCWNNVIKKYDEVGIVE